MAGTATTPRVDGTAKNLADALKAQYDKSGVESATPPLKQVKLERIDSAEAALSNAQASEATSSSSGDVSRDRGKSKRIDALLGQANVLAARGNIADAMELLREVIRQDHKHPMAYQQIATVYEQEGDHQKALQFGLLASHLDPKTPAEDWIHWGDEAKRFAMYEEAAVCYDRALHINNENWTYYEKRIEMLDRLNLRPLAMRTRLQAAQTINHRLLNVDFSWFHELIRKVAQYYITMNDEEKAIQALEAFVLRSREFGENAEPQHETLVGMHLKTNKFQLAGKSIISLCKGIRAVKRGTKEPACEVKLISKNSSKHCFSDIVHERDLRLLPVPTGRRYWIRSGCHSVPCQHALLSCNLSVSLDWDPADDRPGGEVVDEKLHYRRRSGSAERC